MEKQKVKFPTPYLAHWVTGPTACCEKHMKQTVQLGKFMELHVAVTENPDPEIECINCINEN